MNIVGIKFKGNGKIYCFKNEGLELKSDMHVVVETEKGEQLGKVVNVDMTPSKNIDKDTMKSVLRIATDKDNSTFEKNLMEAKEALNYIRELVKKENIDMSVSDSSYTLDKKQLTFNFIADQRVDFRELVKELAAKFKTRIELHQMGARDKAKSVGGLGPCGRPLCCGSFLSNMETISINMAKNQNLVLNPTKINGACGRLLCCLAYEDNVYTDHRCKLPQQGSIITTEDGKGKVTSLDVLNLKYTVDIDGDNKEYEYKEKEETNKNGKQKRSSK